MRTQLNRGLSRRVMYIENKDGLIDGARGRIGWVGFSKTGQFVYYRGRMLQKSRGISGNFFDAASGDEYWVSGVKQRGSNGHPAEQSRAWASRSIPMRSTHIGLSAQPRDQLIASRRG